MTIQNNVTVDVAYAPEATFGVAPGQAVASAKIIRRVQTSLALGKDIFQSAEVRSDQQVSDLRHGTKRPAGSIDAELSAGSYDDWIEALLRGTWTAGVSLTNTQLGSITTDGITAQFTFASGDPAALGLRIGDVVRTTGSVPAIDNDQFRITGFSGTSNRVVALDHVPGAAVAADTTFTIAVPGKKVTNGTLRRSFTVEQRYNDIVSSEQFLGMRVGSGQFRVPPNGMATCAFAFMGSNGLVLDGTTTPVAPYFTTPTPQGTTRIMAGPSGSVRFSGAERAIVTSADFTVDNQLSADPVVGSNFVPDIFYGVMKITGTIALYLQDTSLLKTFYNEQEVDLVLVVTTAGSGAASDFLSFNMQRVKLSGATKTIGAQGGVVLTCPFQALVNVASTGVDGTTLTVQRSNS